MITLNLSGGIQVYFARSEKITQSLFAIDTNHILLTNEDWHYFRKERHNPDRLKKLIDSCKKVSKLALPE